MSTVSCTKNRQACAICCIVSGQIRAARINNFHILYHPLPCKYFLSRLVQLFSKVVVQYMPTLCVAEKQNILSVASETEMGRRRLLPTVVVWAAVTIATGKWGLIPDISITLFCSHTCVSFMFYWWSDSISCTPYKFAVYNIRCFFYSQIQLQVQ